MSKTYKSHSNISRLKNLHLHLYPSINYYSNSIIRRMYQENKYLKICLRYFLYTMRQLPFCSYDKRYCLQHAIPVNFSSNELLPQDFIVPSKNLTKKYFIAISTMKNYIFLLQFLFNLRKKQYFILNTTLF